MENTNLKSCNLCPNACKVNRIEGKIGQCCAGKKAKIALVAIHNFEEPCISGINGSGTIFFVGCNLKCVYCQNYKISQQDCGEEVSERELAQIMLQQQENNVHNINLVTPTPYIETIIPAVQLAKKQGLKIPIIYNCGGYESVKTIQKLSGIVDIYLPDFKYAENELGKRLSNVSNYFENAVSAIKEMEKQVGTPKFNEQGMIQKGLIIRHLILPNHIRNTKKVLKWISENIDKDVYVSIMAQYFPSNQACKYKDLNRKVSRREYREVEKYLFELNFTNGYLQELGHCEEKYVPNFEGGINNERF